jgi:hypothetical protein
LAEHRSGDEVEPRQDADEHQDFLHHAAFLMALEICETDTP